MQTLFLAHATGDRQFSRDLTEFLRQGTSVQVFLEDGEIGAGETIVSKAADGLQAEAILVVLSPSSAPARWVRAEWEPALRDEPRKAGVKVGTILAAPCDFPELLRRESFFDATEKRLAAFREIKRWVLGLSRAPREGEFTPARQPYFEGRDHEMETLMQALADAPGNAVVEGRIPGSGKTSLALEFARRWKHDFEGLVWLSCAGQSLAALAGEMGAQLGMRLEHDVEQNVQQIAGVCAKRRILVVLDDATEVAAKLIARGRSSTLLTTSRAEIFEAEGAQMIPIDPIDELAPRRVLAALDPEQRSLLDAACACGNAPFRLRLIEELAGSDLNDLIKRGLAIQLDDSLCVTHSVAREAAPPSGAFARSHAQAVNRSFADWTRDGSQCEADLPQLRHALDWALAQADEWMLARELSKRGVAFLRRKHRQAEAFELLETVLPHAEQRDDRRMLEDCKRERMWILDSWDRHEDAATPPDTRRPINDDQMSFDF